MSGGSTQTILLEFGREAILVILGLAGLIEARFRGFRVKGLRFGGVGLRV